MLEGGIQGVNPKESPQDEAEAQPVGVTDFRVFPLTEHSMMS